MINKTNFQDLLIYLNFAKQGKIFVKNFGDNDFELKVDFDKEQLIYPEDKGFIINERQTCNFKAPENFVVFECVHKLLSQGYNPAHIELEPKWQVGHGASGGRADILIKDNDGKSYLIIECKTAGDEFNKAWNATQTRPTQIFSYAQQERSTKFIALYASDFIDGDVSANYYLINLFDSPDISTNKKIKSYADATTVDEIYQVWRDTYVRDYTSFGIFENNQAYHIGEHKPILSVLKNINSQDIQGKYHQFATILRQHNVSGRENAFDKLVNLFLCKVVDEKENPEELKFYWNGKAYDDPFDFQDRLQRLYKNGMEKFLGETITYIDNNQIEEAFSVFKNKPNATKARILEFLRAQKFFTNNDFAFIEVHNEKLFHQNFDVLLKISRMIQDINLTGSEENQFLGDMFEGFLDQGIKQSEGQFFTPMPIVKFIINSLPTKESPQVIDYAAGSGHFLNEYASNNPNSDITGIEKEYRLSKVAKVSSFMYGNEIKIIYDDALRLSSKVKNNSFDVLIANPPYSVKGFLEMLSDEDRNSFELINTVDEKSYTANNAIECFFIERAKQLLAKDGVAGIIVPSSILNKGSQAITANKGNVYVATREILLKYFEIVAIAEFGSGTFGKTGTNTVTLFLKRRSDNPNLAEHYHNMVASWFDGDFASNQEFADNDLLARYCNHISIDIAIYQKLLLNNLADELFGHEIFVEYQAEFEKLPETKNRRNKRGYKELDAEQKSTEDTQELIKYIKVIEQDKLYYFCLAYKNTTDVIIVKSPSGNNEIKKFLGYEWSSAKGNEGIKYLAGSVAKVDDESLDEEDKRILENLQGLKSIKTPLYNPQNKDDGNKINSIIANNFSGNNVDIPEELAPFVSKARLIDMLDFSRVEFNKAIGLSVKNYSPIASKYKMCKLSDVFVNIRNGKNVEQFDDVGKYQVSRIESIATGIFDMDATKWTNDNVTENDFLRSGDILFSHINSVKHLAKTAFFDLADKVVHGVNLLRFRPNVHMLIPKFAFELLQLDSFTNEVKLNAQKAVNQASVNIDYLSNLKIPVPPIEIQEHIVAECQAVDVNVANAKHIIIEAKQSIEQEINSVSGNLVKLGDVAENLDNLRVPVAAGKRKEGIYPYYGASGIVDYVDSWVIDDYVLLISEDGANLKTRNTPIAFTVIGKAWVNNHAHILKFRNKSTHRFVELYLNHLDLSNFITGQAQPKLSQNNMNQIRIPLPSLDQQKEIVACIEIHEQQITQAQQIIDTASAQKQSILNKYLN